MSFSEMIEINHWDLVPLDTQGTKTTRRFYIDRQMWGLQKPLSFNIATIQG